MGGKAGQIGVKSRGGRPRKHPEITTAFSKWFHECGLSPQELAAMLDCGLSYVYNLKNGARPSLDMAFTIADASGGAVPVDSWRI